MQKAHSAGYSSSRFRDNSSKFIPNRSTSEAPPGSRRARVDRRAPLHGQIWRFDDDRGGRDPTSLIADFHAMRMLVVHAHNSDPAGLVLAAYRHRDSSVVLENIYRHTSDELGQRTPSRGGSDWHQGDHARRHVYDLLAIGSSFFLPIAFIRAASVGSSHFGITSPSRVLPLVKSP